MKLIFANPKYWPALWQDTIGQEDKAKATLGLDTLAKKQDFWYTTAVLCAVVGVLAAVPTYGVSLALLLVTWRKWDLIRSKKETPPPTPVLGLLAAPAEAQSTEVKQVTDVGMASGATTGRKTLKEKLSWLGQSVAIQFRTRRWLPYALVGGVCAAAVVGGVAHQQSKQQAAIVAPKQLCECPLKQEPPVQGKAKATKEKK